MADEQPKRRATRATTSRPGASPDERMPSLPFIWWAIGLALTAGFAQGMALFALIAARQPLGPWWVAAAQAHGHVQVFGWGAMFALGVGLYFLPRLRGCPPPSPRAVRTAAWLLGPGLALRAVAQPLSAALEPGWLDSLASGGLLISGALELAGATLAAGALVAAARRGPPLATRAGLVAVLPFGLAFFALLLAALAANAVLLISVAASGTGLLPGAGTWAVVHLGLNGMLVAISAAVSARTFPLYLRLRVPPRGELHAVFALYLVGILLRSLSALELSETTLWLPASGALLEGIAFVALVIAIDVPLRRTRRIPLGQEGPPRSEDRAAEWLITSSYSWLAVAGLLSAAEGLSHWGLVPRPPLDAERHALGVGLVMLLILGMAVRLLPGFTGRRLHSAGLVWATVWLGNGAALLRVTPLFLPASQFSAGLLALSGLLALAAVACLGWNLNRTLRGTAGQRSASG